MARLGREHLSDMSNEGSRVKERRERLGIGKKALAELAGVNRNTLAAIEGGESFNRTSLAKLERVLDDLEEEAGIDAPPRAAATDESKMVKFRLDGLYGVRSLVVEGPIEDKEGLLEIVQELMRGSGQASSKEDDD